MRECLVLGRPARRRVCHDAVAGLRVGHEVVKQAACQIDKVRQQRLTGLAGMIAKRFGETGDGELFHDRDVQQAPEIRGLSQRRLCVTSGRVQKEPYLFECTQQGDPVDPIRGQSSKDGSGPRF